MGVLRALMPAGLIMDETISLAEAGVDSLALAELAASVSEQFGVDLSRVELDGSSTVGEVLAAVVDRAAGSAWPPDLPPGTGRLQDLADGLGGRVLGWWLALEVEGAEHVPERGPVVLAMNHESALDIPIAVVACPRRITFMAKRELFKNAFVSWWLRELGGFRVDRDRFDVGAVGWGLAVLRRGGVLGMYPEGTRAPGRLLPFLPGAAWMALRTGAPLVPCAVTGTADGRLAARPRRARVRVRFRPPIVSGVVTDARELRGRVDELTAELRSRVAAALPRTEAR